MKNTETNEGNDKLEYDGITTSEILDKGHSKDHTSTSKFLRSLYGNEFDTGHLVLWTKPDKKSHFFAGNEMDKAAETAMFMADLMDVYYGVGLQEKIPADGGRGKNDTVVCIPGLWIDLDIQTGKHKLDKLPPDTDAAMGLLADFKLKPTIIASTGGGFHVYWLFDAVLMLSNDKDREKASDLSRQFQDLFIKLAARKGWHLDNTSDLSRVLRLPGTYNHKSGDPVPVKVVEYNESSRYSIEQIERCLEECDILETVKPAGDNEIIKEGSRNTTLTSIGGKLRADGHEYECIRDELIEINEKSCVPPLQEEEVDEIAKSVSSYPSGNGGSGGRMTQADRILAMADAMELFHTADGETYADIPVAEHREIWPLKSKDIRHYLSKAYYDHYGTSPSAQGMQNALEILHGKAQFAAPEKPVYVRLAGYNDAIYLDLCNQNWDFIEITKDGWSIIKDPPVAFRRPKSVLALPEPVRGGQIDELRTVINVKKESEWVLIVSWLIGAFCPKGPYPILLVHGEQGSAKSTTAKILRELIDPSASPLRSLPRGEHELMINAKNAWVIAFDNLSGIKPWLSDAFCRLSTGGGFSVRGLYTDSEEIIFDAERPIILNGIDDIANRQDLASRAIIVNLPRIPEDRRKLETDLWREFNRLKPAILGGILDTVSFALRNYGNVSLSSYPRMADFAKWIVAAEPSLPWMQDKFIDYYKVNQRESANSAFEADIVAMAIKSFVEHEKKWEGTVTDLMSELKECRAYEEFTEDRSFPRMPNYLSNRINRVASALRSAGIKVEYFRKNNRRIWRFCLSPQKGDDGDDQVTMNI